MSIATPREVFSPANASRHVACPQETEVGRRYSTLSDLYADYGTSASCDAILKDQVLATEPRHDDITVLGEVVDKLLMQVDLMRQSNSAQARAELMPDSDKKSPRGWSLAGW